MLKKALVVVGCLVAVVLVVPLALSPKLRIDRSVEIQSSPATVHAYLADLNQYPKWNPFSEGDPSSTETISGSGVGSTLKWKGEKTGEGQMTITKLEPSQSVRLKLQFYTPMAGEALIEWKTEALDATKTRMTWSMDEDLTYFQRYFGLMMSGAMGNTFERGLTNLKGQLEKS